MGCGSSAPLKETKYSKTSRFSSSRFSVVDSIRVAKISHESRVVPVAPIQQNRHALPTQVSSPVDFSDDIPRGRFLNKNVLPILQENENIYDDCNAYVSKHSCNNFKSESDLRKKTSNTNSLLNKQQKMKQTSVERNSYRGSDLRRPITPPNQGSRWEKATMNYQSLPSADMNRSHKNHNSTIISGNCGENYL